MLANLGEEPPLYRETTQQWLLIDLLTALRAGNLRENLTQDLLEAIRSHADDLWRSDHPAAADTMEATRGCDTGHRQDTGEATAPFRAQGAHPQVTNPRACGDPPRAFLPGR